MRRPGEVPSLLLAFGLCCAGCAVPAAGSGQGTLSRRGESVGPVVFQWRSEDGGQTGTMTATLGDGRTFGGPFFQLTRDVERARLAPLWVGWERGWRGWRARDVAVLPDIDRSVHYSGLVLSNLAAPDGVRMRCRFQLAHPLQGLSGGGEGICQLRGGGTIDAVL
jgi:hypothetical protein